MKLKTASRGVKARVGHDSHVSKEYGLAKIFQASSAVALGQGIFLTIFFPERHKYLNFCKAILVFFHFILYYLPTVTPSMEEDCFSGGRA